MVSSARSGGGIARCAGAHDQTYGAPGTVEDLGSAVMGLGNGVHQVQPQAGARSRAGNLGPAEPVERMLTEVLGETGSTVTNDDLQHLDANPEPGGQLFDELASSLSQLPLYRCAVAELGASSAAAVSMWWLAVAPAARRALPADLDAAFAPWLERDALPAPLATEVELLRSQVEFLLDRAGSPAPPA